MPAILISGDTDPASPPHWGEAVHAILPNSVALVVPGGHVPDSECTDAIANQMARAGSTKMLDLSCIDRLRPARFR